MDTAHEQRAKILELVREYEACARDIRQAIIRLENVAESLLMPAVDEHEHAPKVKRVKYNRSTHPSLPAAPSERQSESANVGKGTGKRAGSKCRKPGHRATTCPERKS